MNRTNFFQLLELDINPPENDPKVIDAAIKRKQTEWSRLRNHPTKGMQARQYINLLPEIRRIMQDPKLRTEEALAATAELKRRLEARIEKLDEHIQLLGVKGFFDEEDIHKLSQLHQLKSAVVEKRVHAWEKRKPQRIERELDRSMTGHEMSEKDLPRLAKRLKADPEELMEIYQRLKSSRLNEIDIYIGIQVRKGYMTQGEISDIALLYGIPEGELLRRVRVPVKKADPKSDTAEQGLDETVDRVIDENLRVVEQPSLYAFLGLWPSSSLEALQKKAAEKETEIRRIAHKDAKVTASATLAGHCLAVFKSDASRYAYDISRAESLLKDLSKDIDLVAADGKVASQFYPYLVRKAVNFGTPPAKAAAHIRNHCQNKNWKIKIPKYRKRQELRAVYLGLGLGSALVLVVIGILWWQQAQAERAQAAFRAAMEQVAAAPTLDEKDDLLSAYLDSGPKENLATRAQMELNKVRRQILDRDYQNAQTEADAAIRDKRFEAARDIYQRFLGTYPSGSLADEFRKQLAQIPELIDRRDFDAVSAVDAGADVAGLIEAAEAYLARHPEGAFVGQVNRIIQRMDDRYYRYIREQLALCEAEGDWNTCIDQAHSYIRVYKDNTNAITLRNLRDEYRINLENDRILTELRAKAQDAGEDPEGVKRIYLDYLDMHPRTSAREAIESELAGLTDSLNRMAIAKAMGKVKDRLASVRRYFSEKKSGTLTDLRTGLVWTMMDSDVQTGRCMDHDSAQKFVDTLDTGGFKDWRLPKTQELQRLFSGNASFPGEVTGEWLWTAERYRRYASGWVNEVKVVYPGATSGATGDIMDARECGSTLAVRP